MKKILSLLFLAASLHFPLLAQTNLGAAAPAITFPTVLNGTSRSLHLADLKGKAVLLEFWATWCGPCVQAMPHLQELQAQFKDRLQIITVTEETEQRIQRFLANRPSSLLFAVADTGEARRAFPYRLIPHSVLISPEGKVVAITEPKYVTAAVLEKVLAGEPVDLPLKEDNLAADPLTYFTVAPETKAHFLVQPELKGVGGLSHSYLQDSAFRGRRLTMINLPLESVYRLAYESLPYGRTLDLTTGESVAENKTKYCIDILVPKGQEAQLLPTLRKELQKMFTVRASLEKRPREVYVLQVADAAKVKKIPISRAKAEKFGASAGTFEGEHVPLAKVADYLESFGMVNLPVVDETGNKTFYDLFFEFEPEKKGAIHEALAKLGLKLEKAQRPIDVLVFR
ncbi:TIGR03435 family protein [Rufibacter sediminis]|uniref:TIGR03435 family protein n=1 Tax=Rufibacter sediminis TaxID=2762756 RepID=A0ABR6VT31_9BACT|nr:TIGR03435 family protein [Rufibacter sediminis]MBC3540327.1 TIGR03435 family protein [Rufibacter sediminis]